MADLDEMESSLFQLDPETRRSANINDIIDDIGCRIRAVNQLHENTRSKATIRIAITVEYE